MLTVLIMVGLTALFFPDIFWFFIIGLWLLLMIPGSLLYGAAQVLMERQEQNRRACDGCAECGKTKVA